MHHVRFHLSGRLLLLVLLVVPGHASLAGIISTQVTAESVSLVYPRPVFNVSHTSTDDERAGADTLSGLYDTGLTVSSYVDVSNNGIAFLAARKYQATEGRASATIDYQLENNATVAQQFHLSFSPLFGFLTAYCADPDGLFEEDSTSILPCGADDFAIASYDANIWLNDQLIWSSMASLRSDINGVSLDTAGTVLGGFYPDEFNYRWDTQWFDLVLGEFAPGEQFSLQYRVDIQVGGQTALQGAPSCEPFDCPYPDNVAIVEYGSYEFVGSEQPVFQFSASSVVVSEPASLAILLSGLILGTIIRRY